jgi:hypothetical protein
MREETILRNKKEADGRKRLARHLKTRKTEKQRYPLPPPTSHYPSTPQQRHPKMAIKQEALSTPRPSRPSAQPIHLTSRSTAQTTPITNPSHLASTATPSIHRSTKNLHLFPPLFPLLLCCNKDRSATEQEHHEHHQEPLQEAQDEQSSKDLKAKLSLNLFFLCHGKPSVTNSKSLSFPSCSVICCVILRCKTV